MPTLGLHHLTAIAGDPDRNLDFYVGVLGLRFVKRTVNFDDPTTYHFYFGDELGRPGSIVTFFPWAGARRGRQGTGQAAALSLTIAAASTGYWIERLLRHGVEYARPQRRFDEQVVAFRDPDGLSLELVAHPDAERRAGWGGGPVPAEHAIRGLHTVTLWVDGYEMTAKLLAERLGFRLLDEEGSVFRYAAGDAMPGEFVDVRCAPEFWRGTMGVGIIHHVAYRVADDAAQLALRAAVAAAGLNPTPQIDRSYFRSVYFREPGGVLFELATDAPGFTIDEPAEHLGERLMLPPQYEPLRAQIEAALPPIHPPAVAEAPAAPS